RLRADGSPYQVTIGGQTIDVTVQDEHGKLDVNEAPVRALSNLFDRLGVDASLADAIGRFREERRASGKPAPKLASDKMPSGNRTVFGALEDLRLVDGLSPEVYVRIAPFLTVYTGEPRVSPLTAPPDVLLSVPG